MYLGKPALNYDLYPETRKTDVSGNLITSAKTLLHGRSIYDVEDVSGRLSERMLSRPICPRSHRPDGCQRRVSVCRLMVRGDLF